MDLCFSHRAEDLDHRYLDSGSGGTSSARAILTCTIPLSEIVTDFFNELKSRSSGFASFEWVSFYCYLEYSPIRFISYEDGGYKRSDLAKMIFLLNGKPVDALALIVHRSAEQTVGRAWVKKLRKGLISSIAWARTSSYFIRFRQSHPSSVI